MIADKLRKSILQAAIQGKLTKQLPDDGDARDLLQEIKTEKTRLIKEGKIKKEKPLPEITEDETSFEIPDNWCWVRLGDIVSVQGGKRIPVGKKLTLTNTGYKYIRVADMHDGTILNTNVHYVPVDVYPQIKNYIINSDDVYITCAGTIGRVGTVPLEFNGANLTENADKLVFRLLDKRWLVFFLDCSFVQMQISECTTKVGQPKLAIKRIENFVIALPPISEQQRIVAAIEKAFIKIKELEKDELKLNLLQKSFPKKMKNSLLQAAIQGKLTEQLISDGDARALVTDIQKEKERPINKGKIKKEKALSEIMDDEIPFDIPDNWYWVRFGDVILQNVGGGTPSKNNPKYWGGNIPWASVKDLNCKLLISTQDYITELGLQNSSSNLIHKDNLIVCTRMGLGKIVFNTIDVAINQDLRALYLPDNIDKKYIYYFYLTISFIGKGATVKGISLEEFSNILIPIPPLAEQQRIVERLEQLLPLCDTLE